MTIKSITLQGFKSFARKTTFRFDDGVSAIVGPNGSGKSNVADGLRWVLGEQSPKTLRVKKTDDLIFAGTGKKAKGSVAEVSVLFDNSSGLSTIDFSEIEISRKLYGSGESDYRLNGRKVKLLEIQQLLATARIGAGSYAIIGQGTIDSLILATPAERKLLFEEASGIRSFELQRTQALRRLKSTDENMQRVRDILSELAPRLETLKRNQEIVSQRESLETELGSLKSQLEAAQYRETKYTLDESNKDIIRVSKEIENVEKKIAQANKMQAELAQGRKEDESRRKTALKQLHELEAQREQLINDSSVQQAELHHLEERTDNVAQIEQRLKQLKAKFDEIQASAKDIKRHVRTLAQDQEECEVERTAITNTIKKVQQKLIRQRNIMQEGSQHEYISHAHTIVSDLHRSLQAEEVDKAALEQLAFRVRRLLKLASSSNQSEIMEQVKDLQLELAKAIKGRETVDDKYTQVTMQLRKIELDYSTIEKEVEEILRKKQELSDQLKLARQIGTNIQKRQAAILHAQEKLDKNAKEIASKRMEVNEVAQPSVEKAVQIARELEKLQAQKESLAAQLKELNSQKKTCESEITKLKVPGKAVNPTGSKEAIERRIITLESRLETLKEVAQGADSELAEARERHDFLHKQLEDMDKAKLNLNEIIEQLNQTIQAQFTAAFEEISQAFGRTFARMFGGGSGKLALQSGNEDELGIEIEVAPPGKRVKHLTALSGGERSLAGLALLAAIVQVNPSPILVLDEVDAALDEANTIRFSQLLEEISARSQIIVITHNRQTMTVARSLFGVTMDHEHVSQVVSVQLPEAIKLTDKTMVA